MAKDNNQSYVPVVKGIPDFPFQYYTPTIDIKRKPYMLVGMDSGIGNAAFSCITISDDKFVNKIPVDFEYVDSFYFAEELAKYPTTLDRQFFIINKYWELFSQENVESLTYELLPITNISDPGTFKGVLHAQNTTALINMVCRMIGHQFYPTSPTEIKFCLTGNGSATKEEMCQKAYELTGDERLLTNNHMADALGDAFCGYIRKLKQHIADRDGKGEIPQKWLEFCPWNFKTMPEPWYNKYIHN